MSSRPQLDSFPCGLQRPAVRGKVALDVEGLQVPYKVTVAVYPSALELINLPAESIEQNPHPRSNCRSNSTVA